MKPLRNVVVLALLALVALLALRGTARATVPSTVSRVDLLGDGLTTAFPFTFKVYETSSVEVFLGGVKQVYGFTATRNANQDTTPGGSVTFITPPANGTAVRIQRSIPLTQQMVLNPGTSFPAKTIETGGFDRAMMGLQQLDRQVNDLAAGSLPPASDGSSLTVGATGSTSARSLGDRFAEIANVKDFGAKGDGTTDDAAAFGRARDALAAGGKIFIPRGTFRVSSTTNLDGQHFLVEGDGGSIVVADAGVSAFTVTNHGKDVTFRNVELRGGLNSVGIDASMAATTASAYRDVTVERCTFRATTAKMIGIRFINARESYVVDSHFVQSESQVNYYLTGVYLAQSVNVVVSRSTFLYAEYGVHSYGTPIGGIVNPFDVGPAIDHCRMLGCKYGVAAEYNDFVGINDSVIDYCDYPVVVYGSQSVIARGNYISSRGNHSAIELSPGSRFPTLATSGAVIDSNIVLAHDDGAGPWTDAVVQLTSVSVGTVSSNIVSPWRGVGLSHDTATHLSIFNNSFIPESGYGTNAISGTNDATSVRAFWNLMGKPYVGQSNAMVDWNRFVNPSDRLVGTATAKGTATITAGNTSVVVNPGVNRTVLFAIASPSQNTPYWIDTLTGNAFTIHIPSALGSNCVFYWFAGTNYSAIQPQP